MFDTKYKNSYKTQINLKTQEFGELTEQQINKLTQHAIDMDKINEQWQLFENHDVVFCVLGIHKFTFKKNRCGFLWFLFAFFFVR